MKYVIDYTDDRFKILKNQDVVEFIRRTNPFAHSDIGSCLMDLAGALEGVHHYSPSFASCFYVVLHTETNYIFAIAYGQNGLAFRLPYARIPNAQVDGGELKPEIGPDWVAFKPWSANEPASQTLERLRRWCKIAASSGRDS